MEPEISCKSQIKIQAEAKIKKQITGCNRCQQLKAMLGEANKKLQFWYQNRFKLLNHINHER